MHPDTNHAVLWTSCTERWSDDIARSINRTRRLKDARRVAVMPDVHLANTFCVGTVVQTTRLLYPSAVGSDIGCGMMAIPFHAKAEQLTERVAQTLLTLLPRLVPAQQQRRPAIELAKVRPRFSDPVIDRVLTTTGLRQLGTLGSGNHFLELQRDQANDRLWLMLHSGSRGLGQAVYEHHLRSATDRSQGVAYLDAESASGRRYLHDVRLARAYARLNRVIMARAVAFALNAIACIQPDWHSTIHTDHNHVRRERIDGDAEDFYVHRKGAASAFAGQKSVIPGSMGTASYHVRGKGHLLSLRSSSHGAGRRMNRATARRSIDAARLKRSMSGVWFNASAATQLRDEGPAAYKDIEKIIQMQRDQVSVVRRLLPVLSYKGV
jgi:tRNA-splicing ligase RtcB